MGESSLDRLALARQLHAEGQAELRRIRLLKGSTPTRRARRLRRAKALLLAAATIAVLPADQRAAAAPTPHFILPPVFPFGLGSVGSQASPNLVDIDGDGDLDAFVGDGDAAFFGQAGGNMIFFRNTGTASVAAFDVPSTNPFGLSDIGTRSTPDFADIDGDGDLDAFVGEDSGNTVFFRNTGTVASPAFASPSTNAFGLSDVGARSSPDLSDIDGDGDLDAFFGEVGGNTIFFRNTGTSASPAFASPSTNPFGLADVGSSSTPTLADIDGDGDLDAFFGNSSGASVFFRNTGTVAAPAFSSPSTNPFGLSRVVSAGSPDLSDIDGDGDLDVFVGEYSGNTIFFRNTGTAAAPVFESPFSPFGISRVGFSAAPDLVDIDGDGDLDAFVGESSGNTIFFRNTGTSASPAFAPGSTNPFGLSDVGSSSAPDLADIDGDGDLDAFVGTYGGGTQFFRNTGTSASPAFATPSVNPFGLANVGSSSSPDLVDFDGDGDLDAFVGERDEGTFFFRNTGTAASPAFAARSTNPFGLSDVGSFHSPDVSDVDNDGDLDVLIGESSGNSIFFHNTGTLASPAFAAPSTNPFGLSATDFATSPDLTDIDGDADLDAFVGDTYGNTSFFRNTGTTAAPAFEPLSTSSFGLSDVGSSSTPDLSDIDGDGDLDAFVGNSAGDTLFFRNTGTQVAPAFSSASTNPFGLSNVGSSSAPDLSDIDGDGDLDAFIGQGDGNVLFFLNTGSAASPAFATPLFNPFGLSDQGSSSSPDLADIDGDGDLDAFVGLSDGDTRLFRNTGNAASPAFAAATFGLPDVGSYSAPELSDFDGDGDADAFVGNSDGNTILFRNTGTAASAAFSFSPLTNPFGLTDVGSRSTPHLADIDADGDLDAFIGDSTGRILFFENDQSPNLLPTNIALSVSSIAENAPANTTVGTLSTTDGDAIDIHSYTLVPGTGDDDNASFTIVGSQLRTATPFDFETDSAKSVRIRTNDGYGGIFDKVFAITVTNANDVPSDIALSAATVAENQPSGTDVGTLSTTDQDVGSTHTYSLVSGAGSSDNAAFSITGSTLKTAASLNFEAGSTRSIRIRTNDGAGGLFDKVFIVTITDVQEPPTNILLTSTTVAENQPSGTGVGLLSTIDPDAGSAHTYALVSGSGDDDNAAFSITGSTLETVGPFDFETDPSKSVRIRTDDGAGGTFDKVFTITVTNINDAPTNIALIPSTVSENQPAGTSVSTLFSNDQDAGATHTYSLVPGAGDTDNSSFAISGSTLETTESFDFEADPTMSIRIRTDDGNGGTFEKAFTIFVTDVPEGLSISDVTALEGDSGTTAFVFTVTRTGDVSAPAKVKVEASSITAKATKDFKPIPRKKRTVSFAAGETSRTVTVKVIGETKVESDETFAVLLSNPAGALMVDPSGIGTITNDD